VADRVVTRMSEGLVDGMAAMDQGRTTAEPDVTAEDGGSIEVTCGRETFFPIKFNGFDVGPVTVRTQVRAGETAREAYSRAAAAARAMFSAAFDVKLGDYLDRLGDVAEECDRRRLKRG
jgi:hypothetical protein